jgi:hypothetical protein
MLIQTSYVRYYVTHFVKCPSITIFANTYYSYDYTLLMLTFLFLIP